MFYIYAHSKPNGSIFYIGKGKGSRAYKKHGRSAYWQSIVAKHSYEVTILAYFDHETDAFQQEINCIHWLDNLCNLTLGGEGSSGAIVSDLTKSKLSASRLGNTYTLGHILTKEHKVKISKSHTGKIHSVSHNLNRTGLKNHKCKGLVIAYNILTGDILELCGNKQIISAGFAPSLVSHCILGKRKSHKGYTFTRTTNPDLS